MKSHDYQSHLINDGIDSLSTTDVNETSENELPTKINCKTSTAQDAISLLDEFSRNTGLHGVRYLFEPNRHWTERLWWTIAFSLCLYACGHLMRNIYNKWDQSPIMVNFDEKSTPIWNIPFPAITICPEYKSKASIFNYTGTIEKIFNQLNLTQDEKKYLEVYRHICTTFTDGLLNGKYDIITNDTIETHEIDGANITFDMLQMAPTLRDTVIVCESCEEYFDCADYFYEIITGEGLCFVFNALNSEELYDIKGFTPIVHNHSSQHWSMENGYDSVASKEFKTFPHRVFDSGSCGGIQIYLSSTIEDLDYVCRIGSEGFKITLHAPDEVPQVSKQFFSVAHEESVTVAVTPNILKTDDNLKDYHSNHRQCYFNKERKLKYFKGYTQHNCELECLTNFTLAECGCVKFSMPRDDSTPICDHEHFTCYKKIIIQLLKQKYVCDCLPACTSITYNAEISHTKYNHKKLYENSKLPLELVSGYHMSKLSVFFKETQFITAKRSEAYGQTDFLANCGGLLGLFMGVSLLSFVEIIYYCSLRLYCNLRTRNNGRNNRKLSTTPSIIPSINIIRSGNQKEE